MDRQGIIAVTLAIILLFAWQYQNQQVTVKPVPARLATLVNFSPDLSYFLQVSVSVDHTGCLIAHPYAGNGSGDLVNLVNCNGFMELPAEKQRFQPGEVFSVWMYAPVK